MSITVVATRDWSGAPTCREVYDAGARYTIDNASLMVFTAGLRILALYPSGSWTSVYVDDTARVVGETVQKTSGEVDPKGEAVAAAEGGRIGRGDDQAGPDWRDDSEQAAEQEAPTRSARADLRRVAQPARGATSRGMRPVLFGPWTGPADRSPDAEPATRSGSQRTGSRIRRVCFGPWTSTAEHVEPCAAAAPDDELPAD